MKASKPVVMIEARTPNAKFFRLLQRIKNIEVDPGVETKKFVDLPPEYEDLVQDIGQFLYPDGHQGRTRFSRLDQAGYPPFFHGEVLYLQTLKGFVKIAQVRY